MPHSVRVMRSAGRKSFFDEPYIEAIHFGKRSCPFMEDTFTNEFNTNNRSRSEVSFGIDEARPDCPLPIPGRAVTYLNMNEACATSILPNETVIGLTFEPMCMIIVLATDSRMDLYNQLLEAGRALENKVQVEVNYTIGLDALPEVASIEANCQNSIVLNTNYKLDKVLQDEQRELAEVRSQIKLTEADIAFNNFFVDVLPAETLLRTLPAYMARTGSPTTPPSQPPESALLSPDAPPTPPSNEARLQSFEDLLGRLKAKEAALVTKIRGCVVGTRTRTCGLSSIEGPNPWLSENGAPCRGYSTLSARSQDFCGYWDAPYNPNAADASEKKDLLQAGPWCLDDDGDVLRCASGAQRTQRAGIWEMQYWLRNDRRMCESKFFRSRIVSLS